VCVSICVPFVALIRARRTPPWLKQRYSNDYSQNNVSLSLHQNSAGVMTAAPRSHWEILSSSCCLGFVLMSLFSFLRIASGRRTWTNEETQGRETMNHMWRGRERERAEEAGNKERSQEENRCNDEQKNLQTLHTESRQRIASSCRHSRSFEKSFTFLAIKLKL